LELGSWTNCRRRLGCFSEAAGYAGYCPGERWRPHAGIRNFVSPACSLRTFRTEGWVCSALAGTRRLSSAVYRTRPLILDARQYEIVYLRCFVL
jgi:hypothetical protein